MRWIALWLLLTCVYLAGWAFSRWATGGGWTPAPETLVHLAVVPPAQVLALWVVATVRQQHRRRKP